MCALNVLELLVKHFFLESTGTAIVILMFWLTFDPEPLGVLVTMSLIVSLLGILYGSSYGILF